MQIASAQPVSCNLPNSFHKNVNQDAAVYTEGISAPEIKVLIQSLLQKCGWIYPTTSYSDSLDRLCRDALSKLDPRLDEAHSIQRCVPVGINIAWGMYGHLQDEQRLVFIAAFTALVTYVDDKTVQDITWIYGFGQCLLKGASDMEHDPVISALVRLLSSASLYFDPFAANIICTSTLAFVSGQMMDHETREMASLPFPEDYPDYVRRLTGLPEAYVVFGFPNHIPLKTYVRAIPGMTTMINFVNDILSFYKEESGGETETYIRTICATRDVSKKKILEDLIEEVSKIHHRNLEFLAADVPASDFYQRMFQGYVAFHAGAERYRLRDLEL